MSRARAFADLASLARRLSRRSDEADDLLQDALLAAIEAGRDNLAIPENHHWLKGVMRNKARLAARSAIRRRSRDGSWNDLVIGAEPPPTPAPLSLDTLLALPSSLRLTALLALNGCTREEIRWLLNISDAALRQRLSQLKRATKQLDLAPDGADMPRPALALGRIRRALLPAVRRQGAMFASHDSDGNLFVVTRSQTASPRQRSGG